MVDKMEIFTGHHLPVMVDTMKIFTGHHQALGVVSYSLIPDSHGGMRIWESLDRLQYVKTEGKGLGERCQVEVRGGVPDRCNSQTLC